MHQPTLAPPRSATPRSAAGRLAAGSALAGAVGALAVAAGSAGPGPISVFLAEGDAAPSTDQVFQTFDRPNMGAGGHVGFAGDLRGDTATDDVVYVDDRLVARQGDPAPGAKGATFSAFEFFETGGQVNAAGDIAYIATLGDVPSNENRAVYVETTLVARELESLAAIPGRPIADFGFAGLTDDGRVGYLVDLDGPTDDDSAVILDGLVLLREGDPLPASLGIAGTFDGNFDELQWNGAGDLLVEANTSLPGAMDMLVLRRSSAGVVDLAASEGMPIDASGGEDFLELILQTAMAESGAWGVRGNLGVAPSTADAIIFTESGFQAQQGDPVPELPGVVLGNFNGLDLNSHGDVLYVADLEGPVPPGVDEGLFLNGTLLVTDETPIAGLPKGAVLTDIGFEDAWINDAGQIVFAASYTGGDGLFRIDVGGGIPCPADFDRNGSVGFTDLTTLLAAWGACPPGAGPCPADLDGDLVVGFSDLTTLLAAFGDCP